MNEPIDVFYDVAGWRHEAGIVNGQRIGRSIPPPHYPTTADLTAFRSLYDADEALPGIVAADYMVGPRYPTTRMGGKSVAVTTGGAWPHEREQGIGHTHTTDTADSPLSCFTCGAGPEGTNDRREANRMRRAAWARVPEHMRRDRYAVGHAELRERLGVFEADSWHEATGAERPESEAELRAAWGDR